MIKIDNRFIFLLKIGKYIIGSGSLFIINKVHCKSLGLVEDVCIFEKYRSKGYGKIIMQYLI